jgi:SnoaL-like domain
VSDEDVLTRMLHAIDRLDWAAVRDSFTEQVATDYTSLWGGDPEKLPADELIARWRGFVSGFAATQHHIGPLVTCDDHVETHVVGYHWLPDGAVWTVHGHYDARLADGKIAELTLQTFHASGPDGLPGVAARR